VAGTFTRCPTVGTPHTTRAANRHGSSLGSIRRPNNACSDGCWRSYSSRHPPLTSRGVSGRSSAAPIILYHLRAWDGLWSRCGGGSPNHPHMGRQQVRDCPSSTGQASVRRLVLRRPGPSPFTTLWIPRQTTSTRTIRPESFFRLARGTSAQRIGSFDPGGIALLSIASHS
jgi:hypothetical protein